MDSLIKDPGRAYIMGFSTMALAMFFGYLWSPDYFELVNNGYNFLYMFIFGMFLFAMTWLIDTCFNKREPKFVPRGKSE